MDDGWRTAKEELPRVSSLWGRNYIKQFKWFKISVTEWIDSIWNMLWYIHSASFSSGSTSSSRRTGTSSESPRPTSVERPGAVHPWVSAQLRNNPSSVSNTIPGSSTGQVQPSHPFIQDPAMPPNPAPNPLTQLEEARRRLEEERRRNALQQAKQRWGDVFLLRPFHCVCLCYWPRSCSVEGTSLVNAKCVKTWRSLTIFVESRSRTGHQSKVVWWLWVSSKSCSRKRATTGEKVS